MGRGGAGARAFDPARFRRRAGAVATDIGGLILVLIPAAILLLLSIEPLRKAVLTTPTMGRSRKSCRASPHRAGSARRRHGRLGCRIVLGQAGLEQADSIRKPTLSGRGTGFPRWADQYVCAMIDDWDTRHNRADLSPEVWQYLKDNGFLGMLIARE